jgi:hypothetical protein
MSNKGERQRMTRLKYINRLKKWNIFGKFDWFALKSTGSPCSCPACKGEKYKRKIKHKGTEIPEE